MLHSAPYRTCVSRPLYTGERQILYFFSTKHRGKTACFPVKRHLGHSTVPLQLWPQLTSSKTTYLVHAHKQGQWFHWAANLVYIELEELNACTREKEKIVELIRSNHLINLHTNQFSRSIIGRCNNSGVSRKNSHKQDALLFSFHKTVVSNWYLRNCPWKYNKGFTWMQRKIVYSGNNIILYGLRI